MGLSNAFSQARRDLRRLRTGTVMPRMCHHERCPLHQPAWPPEDPTFPASLCETQRTRRPTSVGKTDAQQAAIGRSRHLAVCPPANCPANQKVLNRDCPPGRMKSSGEKQQTYLGIMTVRMESCKAVVRNNGLIWEWNIALSEYLNAIGKGHSWRLIITPNLLFFCFCFFCYFFFCSSLLLFLSENFVSFLLFCWCPFCGG